MCKPLRELSAAMLYDIMHVRCAVFIVEQTCPYLDTDNLDKLPSCLHLAALDDDQSIVAYARLLGPGSKGSKQKWPMIGRVVIAPAHRGQGVGKILMEKAIAECRRAWPKQPIEISAQAHLEAFYKSLGFNTTSEPYDDDGILHIDMVLNAE
ncbi:GNAT family acetyltransferase [Thraustotheca clavata]|uniref:GNAT family acetyltransferase n=1 Tax=Thraustotheca clavata TaxID=74557 RepID=A0A1V9ZPE2_9STRA|nr:GNAT family acetyltransferase [Thraustotheca clavata]